MTASRKVKTTLAFLIKLLGTSLFLYWAFSQLEDKEALWKNFQAALHSPSWVILGLTMGGLTVAATALRLYILLRAQSVDVTLLYIGKITLVSSMFNIVSFGTAAGDAMKMICIMRRNPDKKIVITMTVMLDHMIGFASGGVIFLVCTWGMGVIDTVTSDTVKHALIAASIFQAGGLVFITLMLGAATTRGLAKFREKLPRFSNNKYIKSVSESLHLFRSRWRAVMTALAVSFVLSLSYYFTFHAALGTIHVSVPVPALLSAMPLVDAVSALPISVSGLGVREKTFDFLLGEMAGIKPSAAITASLIGFMFHLFWGLVGGLYLVFDRSIFSAKDRAMLAEQED
ncbi:MAG: lysylphosphatidylglycerol synthase transmembrane domain-containing protein [Akkermansiaceae bacterium]